MKKERKAANSVAILAGNGLLPNRFVLQSVIATETAIAAYLVVGNKYWSWVVSIATFVCFSVASGYAIATGQDCAYEK